MEILKKIRLIVLALLSLLVILWLLVSSKTITSIVATREVATPLSLEEQKRESAIRGINWLISQKDVTPVKANVANFRNIYRFVENEDFAQKSLEIAKENFFLLSEVNTDIDIYDKKYLNWQYGLRPAVEGLSQKKCAGVEYTDDAKNISKLLEIHMKEIFPEEMALSSKLIAAYLIKKVGLDKKDFYRKTIFEIQSKADIINKPFTEGYIAYLYALTHIILAESDYFSFYLNPELYRAEIVNLNNALGVFSSKEVLSDAEMDIASEIIFGLKLLQIKPNEKTNKLYQKIIAMQNPDGSWGKSTIENMKPDIRETPSTHHTFVAVAALSDFAVEFRAKDAHCLKIN